MATHLARHLHESGHRIISIYSRSRDSADRLAREIGTTGTSDPLNVPDSADFFIASVPDSVLPGLVAGFSGKKGIWLHTAGALSVDIFRDHHPEYGVLYPLQTLSIDRPVSLVETPFLVEGSTPEVQDNIVDLAGSISGNVQKMDSSTRLVIHLAAVFANNFSNHMVHIAQRILEDQEVDQDLLGPILNETFGRFADMGAGKSQTGPAKRGDMETMQKHLELLKTYPEWENLYTFISRDIGRTRDE
ncbi:MAG: DUF2520 domain-containing protein [Bacteroidales bacterium]|nr:DUF2520 domain-containing protein [Bacteroidales bacterium]